MLKHRYAPAGWLLILWALLSTACSKPLPVSFVGYRNVKMSNQGFATGIIKLDMAFYNPNPFPLQIKGTQINVLINKQPLGEISQNSASLMPAKDTFIMPVSVRVNLVDLVNKVLNQQSPDSLLLEADGSCQVGRSGVYMHMPLHYRSKEVLKLF